MGKLTIDSEWVKRAKRGFCKQLHANLFQFLTEMDAFLGNSDVDARRRDRNKAITMGKFLSIYQRTVPSRKF